MKTLNDYMAMSYPHKSEDKDEGLVVVSWPDLHIAMRLWKAAREGGRQTHWIQSVVRSSIGRRCTDS